MCSLFIVPYVPYAPSQIYYLFPVFIYSSSFYLLYGMYVSGVPYLHPLSTLIFLCLFD